MGGGCHDDQFWDHLLNECLSCHEVCDRPRVINRCSGYCESARCTAQPGHHYDGLLKTCVRCVDVCGRHPAECSPHCHTASPPATTKRLAVPVTPRGPNPRGLPVATALDESAVLLYSLLVLCKLLLFTSLALALVVLVRNIRAKTSKPGARKGKQSVIQVDQEADLRPETSKATKPNQTRDREPSYDSSPTETCVCVHCFPDLKAPNQDNGRPAKAPFPFYHQAVLHGTDVLHKGPVWADDNLHNTRLEVQEEVAVG